VDNGICDVAIEASFFSSSLFSYSFGAPNKMIVAPRICGFGSGKEGEAGHPRMVDTA